MEYPTNSSQDTLAADESNPFESHYLFKKMELEREIDRLEAQFWFYHKYCGGNLIVRPEVSIPPSGAVLDAGTGTGAWVLALSKEVPSTVSLHAIDLDPSLFRHETLQENLHYSLHSVTALPPDWTNKFDFVNQRLLSTGLSVTGWRENLAELYRVTKPGGNIQLLEFCEFAKPISRRPESPGRKFDQIVEMFAEYLDWLSEAVQHLPRMVLEAGFQDVHVEVKQSPRLGQKWGGYVGLEYLKLHVEDISAAKSRYLTTGVIEDGTEFDELLEGFKQECEDEGPFGWRIFFVCARK